MSRGAVSRGARGRRAGVGLVGLVAALGMAAGCGQPAGGGADGGAVAAGGAGEGVPTSAAESHTPESDGADAHGSGDADPCAWLDPADRSTAGLTVPGQRRDVGGAPACDYTESGVGGVTITVDDTSGLDGLRTGQEGGAERVRIEGRDALRIADREADDGTCAVLLATGPSSSVHVDVSSVDFTDTETSCTRATTVAELIAPDLPGRSA